MEVGQLRQEGWIILSVLVCLIELVKGGNQCLGDKSSPKLAKVWPNLVCESL
jgi:hypothetical protein